MLLRQPINPWFGLGCILLCVLICFGAVLALLNVSGTERSGSGVISW